MPTDENAQGNSNAPEQPQPTPSRSPIEGNKNDESGNNESNRHKIEYCKEKPAHWSKGVEAVCAIALVFITGVYTHYAGRQIEAMINQFQSDQRPWVGLDDINGLPALEPGVVFNPNIVLSNTGKTPAIQSRHRAGFLIPPAAMKFVPEDWVKTKPYVDEGTITPGQKRTINQLQPIPLSGADVDGIKSGMLRYYLFGEVTYKDQFGLVVHETDICLFLQKQANGTMAFTPCQQYNDAK